jgi:putative ABC transport system permease protein
VLTDFRHALRGLRRAPGFAAAVILTLALGVGANTGAFSALNSLLLKPLPYPEPQRLVALYETTLDRKPRGVAEANLFDWRARTHTFDSMAGYSPRSFGLTTGDRDPVTVIETGMVTADFFHVLKIASALGRTFTEQEEIGEAHVIVLTGRLWRKLFAADPGAIGRIVFLNEVPHTVIGVMPEGFEFPMERALPDAFIPLSRKDYCCGRLGSQNAIARLKPGVTRARARSELESAAAALAAEYPASNAGRTAGLQPLEEAMNGTRREPLVLLMAASLLLLLIACANVAGLVLSRCLARSHEISIRAALGAGMGRIARQFLAEAALLSLGAACLGTLAAQIVLRAVPRFIAGATDRGPLQLEGPAFAFAFGLTLAVTLLLALTPTLLVRRMVLFRRHSGASRHPIRGALVIAQVALSVVLLLSTGLLLRSFLRLIATNPGFETAHALKFGIGVPEKRYDTDLKLINFHRRLLARLGELPGVERAGAAMRFPLRGGVAGPGGSFQIYGANIPMGQRPRAWVNCASPGYFAAMGIPMLEGRDFSWQDDRPVQHRVAIVNQTFARTYLRNRRALGTLLDIRWVSELNPLGTVWEIVGVVGDTRQANMDHDPIPEIFLSMTQVGADGGGYVVRGNIAGLAHAITQAVAQQDPRIQRVNVEPLSLIVERNLGSRNAAIQLVGAFGGLALLLTAIGIYGIVAFRAAERRREMAIRLALGATGRQVRELILGHGVRVAAAGTAAGLACFTVVSPYLKSQLYGVKAADWPTIAAVSAGVFAVSLGASLAPSRRAAKAEPMDLFRDA